MSMHSPEFEIVPAREANLAVEIVEAKLVNDEYAIKVFLDVYKNTSAHTVRSYKKECLRFLLWLHTRYPAQPFLLPNVTNEDISDYLDFLGNPAPFSADFLKAHGWKHQPFRKALDPESRKHCVTVLNKMFTTLRNIRATGNQPYCLFNPVADAAKINRRNKSPDEEYQSLTPEEWQTILDTIEDLPRENDRDIKHYHRARWIMQLLYRAFLRRDEAASLRMSDFKPSPDGWFLSFIGKGNKPAKIIATSKLMEELGIYRRSLGLPSMPVFGEDNPAIMAVTGGSKGVSDQAIYLICKTIFGMASDRMASVDSAASARLAQATPHWMRHTGITHTMESGVHPRYVQAQARHSSLNVTAAYDHKEQRAWRKAFESVK